MAEYVPYVPQKLGELMDQIRSMMLTSPTFVDTLGYFPTKGINTEFWALTEGLTNLRATLGEERYEKLVALAAKMRAHFEADPNDETGEAVRGREVILEMEEVVKSARDKRR